MSEHPKRRSSDSWRSIATRVGIAGALIASLSTLGVAARWLNMENTWDDELEVVANRLAEFQLVSQLQVGELCNAKIEALLRRITLLEAQNRMTPRESRELGDLKDQYDYWRGVCRGK